MRIVLVSTERSWRGGEAQLALLAEGLVRRGHDLAVAARGDGELARRLAGGDCPIHPLRGRSLASPPIEWSKKRSASTATW